MVLVNEQYCLNCYWRDLLNGSLKSDDLKVGVLVSLFAHAMPLALRAMISPILSPLFAACRCPKCWQGQHPAHKGRKEHLKAGRPSAILTQTIHLSLRPVEES